MRAFKVFILFSLVALIISCETVNPYIKNNPNIDPKVRDAILNKEVFVGMSKEQVIASWGKDYSKDWVPRFGEEAKYDYWNYYAKLASNKKGWSSDSRNGQFSLTYGTIDTGRVIRYQLIFRGNTLAKVNVEKGTLKGDLFWPDTIEENLKRLKELEDSLKNRR